MSVRRAFAFAVLCALPSPQLFAGDLRCSGSIISPRTTAAKLVELCGEPAAKADRETEIRETDASGKETVRYDTETVWLYDVGEGSFLRAVHVGNDQVRSVRELNKRGGIRQAKDCVVDSATVTSGDPAVLLSYLCGEPTTRRVVSDEYEPMNGQKTVKRRVRTEAWRFAGVDKELQVTLRNGQVVSAVPVETTRH